MTLSSKFVGFIESQSKLLRGELDRALNIKI